MISLKLLTINYLKFCTSICSMIFQNICINLYYKYFNVSSIKHAKSLLHSARCVVRLLSMCSLTLATAPSGRKAPCGCPFQKPLLKIILHLHFKMPPIEVVSKKTSKNTTFSFNLYRIDFKTHFKTLFGIVTFSFLPFHNNFQNA